MKSRMSPAQASHIAHTYHIPLGNDFHTLRTSEVESVLNAADAHGYRKPKSANGSRARGFYEYLMRSQRRDRSSL